MSTSCSRRWSGLLLAAFFLLAVAADGHSTEKQTPVADGAKSAAPKIADEPRTIDPAEYLPASLTARATVDLRDSTLEEVADWLREKCHVTTVVDANAIAGKENADKGLLPVAPISDRLENAPIYFLLNRLRPLGVGWYFEDDILHLTSVGTADARVTMATYSVGDLLRAGCPASQLVETIETTINPDSWRSSGTGEGDLCVVGDVLFVSHTRAMQGVIQAFLKALRKPGRQTFVHDPAVHLAIREKLEKKISVSFEDVPLGEALKRVAKTLGVAVQFDHVHLADVEINLGEPVTLKLADRKARVVLAEMVSRFHAVCIVHDGALCVTYSEHSASVVKTAVYDVRDLCRDLDEALSLIDAMVLATDADAWKKRGVGEGDAVCPIPGVLVVLGTERLHQKVRDLLESYRTTLRELPGEGGRFARKEVTTVYYRMDAAVAKDAAAVLPQLVEPESWRSPDGPDGPGVILRVASRPEVMRGDASQPTRADGKNVGKPSGGSSPILVPQAVLIIRHTPRVHKEIARVVRSIENGEQRPDASRCGGGMGMFSLPVEDVRSAKSR